ncbi:MAG: hypothetical protein ACODAE_09240 [Gemmatimonadota bacterium]
MTAMIAALRADTALMAILEDRTDVREEQTGAQRIPALTYLIVDNDEMENTEGMLTRWGAWGATRAEAVEIERRLRAVLVADVPIMVEGVAIWSELQAARDVPDDDPASFHRSIDLVHEFAREE